MIAGTIAVGLHVEASYRDLPGELGPAGLTAGLSLRLPLLASR